MKPYDFDRWGHVADKPQPPREWEHDGSPGSHCPIDHTCGLPDCGQRNPSDAFGCTRRSGHTGRHAAGTGEIIAVVWS